MVGTSWEPPAPGEWTCDRSHFDRPPTGFSRGLGNQAQVEGFRAGFGAIGCAMDRSGWAVLRGYTYTQTGATDPSTWQELEAAGKDFLANRRWVQWIERWEQELKPERSRECRALSSVDISALDDTALMDHLDAVITAQRRASRIHFEQHALCFLIGELVLSCREWGIADDEVLPLLEGYSPASAATAARLGAVADALREEGVRPSSLEEVRAASPAAAAALDEYLLEHGFQPVGGFDLDARCLAEMPDVVLTSVLAAMDEAPTAKAPADPASVRARVPEADRPRFDQLLADARSVYGVRDDDVRYSLAARGLSRLVVLEAGRRLAARGRLHDADHVLELNGPDELRPMMLDGATAPTAEEVRARYSARSELAKLVPPAVIGGPPIPLPYDDMPPIVRRQTQAMMAYSSLRRAVQAREPLTGIGIGHEPYRARARVATNVDDAFERIEPGDVLVVVLTTPALNGVLMMCGGLVVEDAGVLSHAAVMARELGIPAVIAVDGATRLVPDGAEVEVDPIAGRVTLLS